MMSVVAMKDPSVEEWGAAINTRWAAAGPEGRRRGIERGRETPVS